ncbi:hypothetical protein AAZX31_18G169500 [Glycine max]
MVLFTSMRFTIAPLFTNAPNFLRFLTGNMLSGNVRESVLMDGSSLYISYSVNSTLILQNVYFIAPMQVYYELLIFLQSVG